MKILLVNPNRYRTPPVPPLGLEYLAGALEDAGHECRLLDLCFADDPLVALEEETVRFIPDAAGLTVRNIDSCIYYNNEFFLDDYIPLVEILKSHGVPVILGGAGFSFIPEGILGCLGADWGVTGPGEQALPHLLDLIGSDPPEQGTVLSGWKAGIDPKQHVRKHDLIEYERYLDAGGLAGFETQKGCFETCAYCSEGGRPVIFRDSEIVVEELKVLVRRGITRFHLCDTEFNQDLRHCTVVLGALIEKGPDISWALYMKTEPYSDELFRLLGRSGADLITLSVPTGRRSIDHVRPIADLAKKNGIKLAVDYLCGFPGDTIESVRRDIEILRGSAADTVGVNAHLRLHPDLAVTRRILSSVEYRGRLLGAVDGNPSMIRPVFYNHISKEMLRDIIGDDPLFKIEGFEKTSNYERIG